MSDEIQQTRYDQLVRRVAGIIGPGSKVSQVITELFPMINVEDPPTELLLLGGTGICFGGGTGTAIVAQFMSTQLFNPADSNKLLTITKVFITSSLADMTVLWGVLPVQFPGGGPVSQTFSDTRRSAPNTPVGVVSQRSSVTQAIAIGQARTPLNVPFELSSENGVAVLAPGTGFEMGSTTAADTIFYSYYWRERTALPSELNL